MQNSLVKSSFQLKTIDSKYVKCDKCGHDHFIHLGTGMIKVFGFECYACSHCGNEVAVDHDLILNKTNATNSNKLLGNLNFISHNSK